MMTFATKHSNPNKEAKSAARQFRYKLLRGFPPVTAGRKTHASRHTRTILFTPFQPLFGIPFAPTGSFFTKMQTNSSVESEMESLSMQCDEMEFPEIVQFVLLTTVRLFSIFSSYIVIYFILKHKPIKNKVNTLVVNLCIIISINFVYATVYQFFNWKREMLSEKIFEILRFVYFIFYVSFITSISMLVLFWFLFLILRNLFMKIDLLILLGLLPPYIVPSIFLVNIYYFNHSNFQVFYYYFILFYCITLVLTFFILIYSIMLKLEGRLKRNKLDYLLYSGISMLISLLPEVFFLTFELYYFDERGPLYYRIYYICFSVDFIKCICPFIVFTWLVVGNKYFRKACRDTFSREKIKQLFQLKKKNGENFIVVDDEILDMKLDLNEVFL